jgi:hypothetical protein
MDARHSTSPVHYFDPILHSIPCGAPGFAEPSTKHSRSVTCQACVAFLRARTTPAPAAHASGDTHAW